MFLLSVSFCEEVLQEQEIQQDEIDETSNISIFMEYLQGVGAKTAPSVIRKRIATKVADAQKTAEETETRPPVDSKTLKEVAKDFDIEVEDSDDEIIVELSEEEDNDNSKEESSADDASSTSSTAPAVDKYFLTETLPSQEVGARKRTKQKRPRDEFEEPETEEEPPSKRRRTKK